MKYALLFLIFLAMMPPARADAAEAEPPVPEGKPFSLAADILPGSALDVSFLLHRPAGRHGLVHVAGEQFRFADGAPAKFWGVNLCWDALYPPKREAAAVARRLAQSGCNLVRLTYWDGGPHGIFRQDRPDSSTLDPERLDRLEYFLAALRREGVYSLLVLGMGRTRLLDGDGVGSFDSAESAGAAYYVGRFFDARVRACDERNWQALLAHVNPYTGKSWAADSAIAGIEILNEASLFYQYDQFEKMPSWLRERVRARWNEWLAARYRDRAELTRCWGEELRPEEDPARGSVALELALLRAPRWRENPAAAPREGRGNDWNLFLAETCRDYYQQEIRFLRSLGIRQPIACNGGGSFAAADKWSNLPGDFFDQHSYHDHPNWNGPLIYTNRSSLKTGLWLYQGLAQGRIAGKPYGVSEYDFCFPNDWRAEGGPMMAAYAAFQGWSLLTRFAYWADTWEDREALYAPPAGIRSVWRIFNDPAAFGQWPLTALLFLRGDVRPARHTLDVGFSRTDTFYREAAHFPPDYLGFLGDAAFTHRVRQAFFETAYHGDADLAVASGRSTSGDYRRARAAILGSANPWGDLYGLERGAFIHPRRSVTAPATAVAGRKDWFTPLLAQLPGGQGDLFPQAEEGWAVSDTGELRYRQDPGILVVDTPRTQGIVGFAGGTELSARDAHFRLENSFGSVLAASLDGRPLRESRRILITAVGQCQNAGFQRQPLGPDRYQATGASLGKGPILIEPQRFRLSLTRARDAAPLRAFALDGAGRRIADLPLRRAEDQLVLEATGAPVTIYYELAR